MKPDAATEAEVIGTLERFCSAFAERDADAVMRLFAPDPDVVVVTSEEPLLRGVELLEVFAVSARGRPEHEVVFLEQAGDASEVHLQAVALGDRGDRLDTLVAIQIRR